MPAAISEKENPNGVVGVDVDEDDHRGEFPSTDTSQYNSINELLVDRAKKTPRHALIACLAEKNDGGSGKSGWVEYTASDMDGFVDRAAKGLTALGLERHTSKSEVVALLGPSNLDFIVAFLALSRMGFTVLFLSTRLATEAYVALLQKTECARIVTMPAFADTVADIQHHHSLTTFPLLSESAYASEQDGGGGGGRFRRGVELEDELNCAAWIVHSSGSTGLPKPIFLSHGACLSNYATGAGTPALTTLPLFHNSGLANLCRGIVAGVCTAVYSGTLTSATVIKALRERKPDIFYCVPYVLKLLAETREGIAELAACRVVMFSGSSCPDDLGDLLVGEGVNLVAHYGQTEMGQLMISSPARDDKAWNYVRPLRSTQSFLHFVPQPDGNTYELVVRGGLPTKVLSNTDDPVPDSYATRDCFVPHSHLRNRWKCVGRLDDRLTLVNGEKVLPLPIEHRIRRDDLVAECLVFGAGRAFPGLLVFLAERAQAMSRDEVLDRLAPTVEAANENAEKFSQISREMIELLPPGTVYPRTDKGTIIRAAAYKRFADLIDAAYVRFDAAPSTGAGERLDLAALQAYLLDLFRDKLKQRLEPDNDFFSVGVDSLQAIRARGSIMRKLDLGGHVLGHNVVFDHPSVRQLATYLHSLASGDASAAAATESKEDELELMRKLVDKYGDFEPFQPGTSVPDGDVVLLTGATGSLGAHILSQLLPLSHVRQVYCLVRAPDAAAARTRVVSSLTERDLSEEEDVHAALESKLVALPADLSRADLGLAPEMLATISSRLTSVIHSAWAVNFNMGIASFEAAHIAGARHLLDLCLAAPFARPARFAFVSSISVAAGTTPTPARVRETYVADPAHAQGMGYARSKWVTEHLVRRSAAAVTGSNPFARVLRVGQIVGDTRRGRWNANEAVPLMLRAATTLGVLPALDETPSWIPVDVCARATVELSGLRLPASSSSSSFPATDADANIVFHVQNRRTFRWTEDLLPALAATGVNFEIVPQREWVARLRVGDQDPLRNPTVKLLEFFAAKYDTDGPGRSGLIFETAETEKRSAVIAEGFDVIGSGLVAKCVERWQAEAW